MVRQGDVVAGKGRTKGSANTGGEGRRGGGRRDFQRWVVCGAGVLWEPGGEGREPARKKKGGGGRDKTKSNQIKPKKGGTNAKGTVLEAPTPQKQQKTGSSRGTLGCADERVCKVVGKGGEHKKQKKEKKKEGSCGERTGPSSRERPGGGCRIKGAVEKGILKPTNIGGSGRLYYIHGN